MLVWLVVIAVLGNHGGYRIADFVTSLINNFNQSQKLHFLREVMSPLM
jgi:hypothetical protein